MSPAESQAFATGKTAGIIFAMIVLLGFSPFIYFYSLAYIARWQSIKLNDLVSLCTNKIKEESRLNGKLNSLDFFVYITHTRYGVKNMYGRTGISREQRLINAKDFQELNQMELEPTADAFQKINYRAVLKKDNTLKHFEGQCLYHFSAHKVTLQPRRQ